MALHIHERVSAQAILKVAAREGVQRSLFADPQLDYREAIQFYQHDVDWANRMILGDSLQVMASLAYRDTWTLGVHSYLAYLRDRLILCRELLADTGSIFVQIGDENLHRVRCVMDAVFGGENSLGLIAFVTTGGQSAELLGNVFDYLLWDGRDAAQVKYHKIFVEKELREGGGWAHSRVEFEDGKRENLGVTEVRRLISEGKRVRPYSQDGLVSQGATASGSEPFVFQERSFHLPPNSHWKTTLAGMERLAQCNRIEASENSIRYVRFLDDFPVQPITNIWDDTNRPGYIDAKRYVVQTSTKVIERCILMTTDPGDLVLDPTCGSGTTAYVAEQWGRRWITIDTSRVAVALARQRVLTATFPFYKVKNVEGANGSTPPSD
ncbi:MAG TPA: site-specific DNA-methyltransferase [Alphaproteobacteria bacterium]|nr:site-specific DNA-methyltransferase [Alphaproteobacteria bacterium]